MLTGEVVYWSSKKQPIITFSTTEAKFVEVAAYVCQTLWMRRILEKLSHAQDGCTTMRCDNSSTIEFSKIHVMHGYSKHIDVQFHFLRDFTRDGVVELVHCGFQD
jgi:hypothetical protein